MRLRLEQAITELDEALKDLRHLMLAALEAQAGPGNQPNLMGALACSVGEGVGWFTETRHA